MRLVRFKALQRFVYNVCSSRVDCLIVFVLFVILILGVLHLFEIYIITHSVTSLEHHLLQDAYSYEPIDVVYTWVNGSDPFFINAIVKHDSAWDATRFDDKNELKYSLRSLERFAPWVRHVYIVTNGQIPHWLDLSCNKVTVVTHDQLVVPYTDSIKLPTFSSAAIETFIHRIPNLSKRFLYLNDDIFLGVPLYPDDLYAHASGVNVFTAWMIPNCATNCPWSYISDGSCDKHCNNEACQYDGGDCAAHNSYTKNIKEKTHKSSTASTTGTIPQHLMQKDDSIVAISDFFEVKRSNNRTRFHRKNFYRNKPFHEVLSNRTVVQHTDDIKQLVHQYNEKQMLHIKYQQREQAAITTSRQLADTKDIFAQSLIHTNSVLNQVYGHRVRKVLAHVGFLLDVDIINAMLLKFDMEFRETQSHRFRSPSDMQYAFSYYHFLMSETKNLTVDEIFHKFDTDHSGTWSDREIRTLLARIYPLPLDWGAVRYLEDIIHNCSTNYKGNSDHYKKSPHFSTILYERYEDSTIPTVTQELVRNCPELASTLERQFAVHSRFKFQVNTKTGMQSNFKMLTSNVTEVVNSLDELRKTPKKFNCINDNLNPRESQTNTIIKSLLEDFYLSFFPRPSIFELPANYRNRYGYLHEYQQWSNRKHVIQIFAYGLCACILLLSVRLFCCNYRAKYVRKMVVRTI